MKKPPIRGTFSRWPYTGHPPAINALTELSVTHRKKSREITVYFRNIYQILAVNSEGIRRYARQKTVLPHLIDNLLLTIRD